MLEIIKYELISYWKFRHCNGESFKLNLLNVQIQFILTRIVCIYKD